MTSDRIVDSYRGYKLVAAKLKNECNGVIWDGKERVHTCASGSLDETLRLMKDFVDERHNEVLQSRTEPPGGDEYVEAFRKILNDLAEKYIEMLKAHYHAPDQTMTATQLANAVDYADYSSANLHYGKVGKLLNEVLPIALHNRRDGTPVFTSALATPGDRTEDEDHWTWTMRPQVAYALEQLGLTT